MWKLTHKWQVVVTGGSDLGASAILTLGATSRAVIVRQPVHGFASSQIQHSDAAEDVPVLVAKLVAIMRAISGQAKSALDSVANKRYQSILVFASNLDNFDE